MSESLLQIGNLNLNAFFILFYFTLFYFILFYFILFYFILFYFILLYFILLHFILFYFILFYFILFYFILFYYFIIYLFLTPPPPQKSQVWVGHNLCPVIWNLIFGWTRYKTKINQNTEFNISLWQSHFDGSIKSLQQGFSPGFLPDKGFISER